MSGRDITKPRVSGDWENAASRLKRKEGSRSLIRGDLSVMRQVRVVRVIIRNPETLWTATPMVSRQKSAEGIIVPPWWAESPNVEATKGVHELGKGDDSARRSYSPALHGNEPPQARLLGFNISLRPDGFYEPPCPAQAGCVVVYGGAANYRPLHD